MEIRKKRNDERNRTTKSGKTQKVGRIEVKSIWGKSIKSADIQEKKKEKKNKYAKRTRKLPEIMLFLKNLIKVIIIWTVPHLYDYLDKS